MAFCPAVNFPRGILSGAIWSVAFCPYTLAEHPLGLELSPRIMQGLHTTSCQLMALRLLDVDAYGEDLLIF